MFEKFIDNKLQRGGGLIGNWNLNEQQSAELYALAMDDDDSYPDHRGRGILRIETDLWAQQPVPWRADRSGGGEY